MSEELKECRIYVLRLQADNQRLRHANHVSNACWIFTTACLIATWIWG